MVCGTLDDDGDNDDCDGDDDDDDADDADDDDGDDDGGDDDDDDDDDGTISTHQVLFFTLFCQLCSFPNRYKCSDLISG